MPDKPDIVETIGQYIKLRTSGKEAIGCCPFHEDRTPSLSINGELGVFFCFGCGATGDVFDFLMKWSGKSFKEVTEHYQVSGYSQRIAPDDARVAAERIRLWILDFSAKLAHRLRDLGEDMRMAETAIRQNTGDVDLMRECLAAWQRQWLILETLHEDLFNPDYLLDIYDQRNNLEGMISDD